MSKAARYGRFIWEYFKANLAMEMEYRVSFLGRVFGMILNDLMWMSFWVLYFQRFPVVQGWTRNDVLTLWCLCELGYGLAHTVFGNALNLAAMIVKGDLDFYLVYPKDPMLHALVSRSNAAALGDFVLGPVAFVILTKPTLWQFVAFTAGGLLVALLFLGFTTLVHCMAFYIGNTENLAEQVANFLIHFSTYPAAIFDGATKVILFTLIPAGFINTIPVRVVREFDPVFFGLTALASVGFVLAARIAFRAGLKRYESGNLLQVRM